MLTNYQIKLINIAVGIAKDKEVEIKKLADGIGVSTSEIGSALIQEDNTNGREYDN